MEKASTIIALFASFGPALTAPTFDNLGILMRGAILASAERTVTACIRAAAPWAVKHFSAYENVPRRAKLNERGLARILFLMIESLIPKGAVVELIADDTLVRRSGPYVMGIGIHRDPLRTGRGTNYALSLGHKWVVLSVGVRLRFMAGWLALPILSELYVSPDPARRSRVTMKKKHRSPARIAKALVAIVARWAPERRFHLICDKVFASHDLADSMNEQGRIPGLRRVTLVSRLQPDAGLYGRPSLFGGRGRRRVKGEKLPSPGEVAWGPDARWRTVEVAWYGGGRKVVQLISGAGLWYRCGTMATWVRWVMVRDPEGRREDQVIFTTDRALYSRQIVETFVCRWSLETTFEETRRHLGLETLRNRTATAVSNSVPLLLGLYSLIVVWFTVQHGDSKVTIGAAPWYRKTNVTFSDMLDFAREDVLMDFFLIRRRLKPSVFFLARFPLNIIYSSLAQKTRAA